MITHRNIPEGYPYPDTHTKINDFDIDDYEEARLVWRLSLSDSDVRSFASDFRMGKETEDNYDGYLEFYERGLDRRDAAARSKKPAPTRRRRKS